MKKHVRYFAITLLLIAVASRIFAQDLSVLLKEADRRRESSDFQGNYDMLKRAEKLDSSNVEVLWRLARTHFDFSDNTDDGNVIKTNVYAGFEYAKRALRKDETSAKSHKWYGILIGRKGEIEGIKQKIMNAYEVSDHVLRAIELDPDDGGSYHTMGRWHYALAELNWASRKFAEWFFATPPVGSFEEARDYFKKAIEKNPKEIRNYLWLGKTFIELDDEVEARKALNQAVLLEPRSKSDRLLQKEAREILDDL